MKFMLAALLGLVSCAQPVVVGPVTNPVVVGEGGIEPALPAKAECLNDPAILTSPDARVLLIPGLAPGAASGVIETSAEFYGGLLGLKGIPFCYEHLPFIVVAASALEGVEPAIPLVYEKPRPFTAALSYSNDPPSIEYKKASLAVRKATNVEAAWPAGRYGGGSSVAIIDSGVYADHPTMDVSWRKSACSVGTTCSSTGTTVCTPNGANEALCARCDPAKDLECGHGSAVASVIASQSTYPNTAWNYVVPMAPRAGLFPVRTLTRHATVKPSGTSPVVYNAINMALGFAKDPTNGIRATVLAASGDRIYPATCDTNEPLLAWAADAFLLVGSPLVVPAGNHGKKDGLPWPACLSNVITVGAASTTAAAYGTVPAFSNSGDELDILAPGVKVGVASAIPSPTTRRAYALMSGTSIAAGHVAGALALTYATHGQVTSIAAALARLQDGTTRTDPESLPPGRITPVLRLK